MMPPTLTDRPVPLADWSRLFALSLLWGGSFLFYKLLAPVLPPATLVLGRVGIAAAVLGAVLFWRRELFRPGRASCGWFLGLGTLNCTLPFILFAWSEHHVASGTAALLNAPTPVMTAVVAHLMTRDEKLTARGLAGAGFALAGVAVLVLPGLRAGAGHGGGWKELGGELACVGATLCYAVGGVLARRVRGVTPPQMAFGMLSGATVSALPVAAAFDRFWELPAPPLSGWASLLGIAVVSTAMAYLVYFRIMASSGATRAALVTFLVPVGALFLGAVVLGEAVVPRDGVAIALIGLGLAVIDGRLLRRIGLTGRAVAPESGA